MTDPIITGQTCSYAMLAAILGFACLALFALIVAGYERWRLGSHLLRECSGDAATAWAELKQIREQNAANDKRLREAMADAYHDTDYEPEDK